MNNQLIERSKAGKGLLAGAVIALALGTVAQAAPAVKFAQFEQDPSSSAPNIQLLATGELAAIATPGGYKVDAVKSSITQIDSKDVSRYNGVAGANDTSFYNCSLDISGMTAIATEAFTIGTVPPFTLIPQSFTSGNFTFWSDYLDGDTSNPNGRTELLTGTITVSWMNVTAGDNVGHLTATGTNVVYTGGAILDAWQQIGGLTNGASAWHMLGVNPTFAFDDTTKTLAAFTANMGGSFDAVQVPEPASVALLALSGLGLFGRVRKQKQQKPA